MQVHTPMTLEEINAVVKVPYQPKPTDLYLIENGTYWRGVFLPNPAVHETVMYSLGLRERYFVIVKCDDPDNRNRDRALPSIVNMLKFLGEDYCVYFNHLYVKTL